MHPVVVGAQGDEVGRRVARKPQAFDVQRTGCLLRIPAEVFVAGWPLRK